MIVMPARQILGPLTINEGANEFRGALVLRRGFPGLVLESTIHRLPYEFRDRNPSSAGDRPQPASLLGGELNLSSQHRFSVGTS
jgi:hypothetical protein